MTLNNSRTTSTRLRTGLVISSAIFLCLFFSLAVGVIGPILPTALVVLAALGLLVVSTPALGTFLVVALVPFSSTVYLPSQMLGIPGFNPLNLMVAATLFSHFVSGYKDRYVTMLPAWMWMMVAPMMVGAAVGVLNYKDIPAMFYQLDLVAFNSAAGYLSGTFLKPLVLIACAMVVAIYLYRGGNPTLILWAMLTGSGLFGLSIIAKLATSGVSLQALGGDNPVMRSFLGFTGLHANAIGLMFNVAMAVQMFSLPGVKSRPLRFFLLLSVAICFLVVLITFSRAGMISLGALVLAFILSRRNYMVLAGGVLLIPLMLPFLPSVFWERLTTGLSSGNSQTVTAGRLDSIWAPLWFDLPNVFLTGGGLMSVAWSRPMIRGEMLPVTHAHNAYLNTIHDLGFFGLLSVLLFYKRVIDAVRGLLKTMPNELPRHMIMGIGAALMVLALQGLSGDMLTPTPGQTYLWICLGALFAHLRLQAQPANIASNTSS